MKKLLTSLLVCAILCASCYGAAALLVPAKCTAYCSKCDTSGVTRSGKKLGAAYCAADRNYWKPGTKIYFPKLNKTYTIEDTGGAVKGKHRFDLCLGNVSKCKCNNFGVKKLQYKVVYKSNRSW